MARQYTAGDEVIAGYRLVQFLGRGGFGEVWKAAAPGGTEVAMKIIPLAGGEGRKEFRSLQRVKRIRHPNLDPILAFWLRAEDGTILDDALTTASLLEKTGVPQQTLLAPSPPPPTAPAELVIAMGLADKSLFDRLHECREQGLEGIPPGELLRYVEDAAKGIDFLNQPIHDLGSGPVAIQHGDIKPHNLVIVGGATQICDFGVARIMGPSPTATVTAGSIAYAAPECLRDGKPSHSSDQYSLAVTYVELRTGSLPYAEESIAAVMKASAEGELDLSRLSAAEQRVIRRATSPDPDKRYPSAVALVQALLEAVAGARPRRLVGVMTKAVGVVLLLAIGAWGTWTLVRRPALPIHHPPLAERNEQPADPGAEQPAPWAKPDVARPARPADTPTRTPPSLPLPTASVAAKEAEWVRTELAQAAPDYDGVVDHIEKLLQRGQASRPEFAQAYLGRGTRWLREGRPESAIADFTRGIAHNPNDFRLFSRRGTAWFLTEQWQRAAEDFTRAVQLDRSDRDLINLGRSQQKLGELGEALASFQAATQANPDNGDAFYLAAECSMKRKDFPSALAAYDHAIAKYSSTSDPLYDLAHAHFYRGMCAMATGPGGLDLADRDFTQALQSPGRLGAIDATLASLASAFAEAGQFSQAAKWAGKAAELSSDQASRQIYQARAEQYLSR